MGSYFSYTVADSTVVSVHNVCLFRLPVLGCHEIGLTNTKMSRLLAQVTRKPDVPTFRTENRAVPSQDRNILLLVWLIDKTRLGGWC